MEAIFEIVFGAIGWAIYRRAWTRDAFRGATVALAAFTAWSLGGRQEAPFALMACTFPCLIVMLLVEPEMGRGWLAALAFAAFILIVGLGIRAGL